ncbi:hypothetical protein ACQEU6_46375 [Spirillospora sp. CA-108201]
MVELTPHGEHSAQYTEHVAHTISEAVRVLNYASGEYAEKGLPYPATIDSVIGSLRAAAGGMDQLGRQLVDRLTRMRDDGVLAVRGGEHAGDPAAAVQSANAALARVALAAIDLEQALADAQSQTGAIGMVFTPDDDEDQDG